MSDIFGIGSIFGSILASNTASDAQQAALNATQQAVNTINAVGAPPDLAQQIVLQQYQQAGILTPQLEQQINAHFQQIQGVSAPVQQAQAQALQQMSQVANSGLTSQDRANLAQLQQQTAKQNIAQQNSILQNLQQRGQLQGGGNSGEALAEQLSASQNNQNQAAQNTLGIAAQAQARSLQGIAGLGNLSGQQAGQQFQQNAQQAAIANEQNRFNTQNQLAIQQQNTQAQNQAQLYNLGNAQQIANANVGQANAEAQREVAAQQQMYQDSMAHAQAAANAQIGQGTQIANFGQQTAASQGQMFAGAGTAAGGAYNSLTGNTNNSGNGTTSGYDQLQQTGNTGYGPTIDSSGNSTGAYSATSWQGGEIATPRGPGYSSGGEVDPNSYKPFTINTPDYGEGAYKTFTVNSPLLTDNYSKLTSLPGYSTGGTVSDMNFHGGGMKQKPAHFPKTPVQHTINPMMLTQPAEFCGGGEVGYALGGKVLNPQQIKLLAMIKQKQMHGQHPGMPMNRPTPMLPPTQPMAGQAPMMPNSQLPPAAPVPTANMMHGGMVRGPEVVHGSSPKNDIIPARLSSGEYVVPKEDAPSMELIHQILKGMKAKRK